MSIYQIFQNEIDSQFKTILSRYPSCQNVVLYTNIGFLPPRIYIEKQIIYIYPDYLEYLWAFCFCYWVFGEETSAYQIDCIQRNMPIEDFLPYNFSPSAKKVYEVTDYVKKKVDNITAPLPIPETDIQGVLQNSFKNCNSDYHKDIYITNHIFLEVLMLLVEHELSHYELGHRPSKWNFITQKLEKEADLSAIRKRLSTDNSLKSALICEVAFSALFCCTKRWTGIYQHTHPHLHKRVLYCMKEIEKYCSPQDVAVVAYRTVLVLVLKLDQANKKFSSYDAGIYVYKYFKKIIKEINGKLILQRFRTVCTDSIKLMANKLRHN